MARFEIACMVLAALSGCVDGEPSDPAAHSPGECIYRPPPQAGIAEFGAGAHYIKTPTGGASWDGRLVRFGWYDDPARLVEVAITAEWNETLGSEQTLRLGVRNIDAQSAKAHWFYGPYNGPSPLQLRLTGGQAAPIGDELVIDIGTTTEGPSSVALVDHEVHVTVQETYLCEDGVAPQGRLSRSR